MSKPGGAANLTTAARRWAAPLPTASITQSGSTVQLRSCDPGTSGPRLPTIKPSAFTVLSARSELIDNLLMSGAPDFARGRCVADKVLSALSAHAYAALLAPDLSPAQESQIHRVVVQAVRQC
jgi:hypothetical protein